jgi:23S rRNA pseudouridine1911/1915/1917 synthase
MANSPSQTFRVTASQVNQTLAALLRQWLPGQSWSQVRQLVAGRRVRINGELWLDPARRLKESDTIELLTQAAPKPRAYARVKLRYLDAHVVVAEKPAGISTVRHPAEREWSAQRRALSPTLQDLVLKEIATREKQPRKAPHQRLRIVHRIDKETSGLVVFARSAEAERGLGKQFHKHTVIRRYLAIVPGSIELQRIATRLVRDRGDGRRGSTPLPGVGKEAVTFIDVVERWPGYTLLSCRLETGRTHQIRIHLAELGHPICGEKVYNRKIAGPALPDPSDAPRLALHAAELGFDHPHSGEAVHWEMPLPADLQGFLDQLQQKK